VLDCDKQKGVSSTFMMQIVLDIFRILISVTAQCNEAQIDAPFQTFNLEDIGPDPLDPEFELLCAP
jgi:hypothetical protein